MTINLAELALTLFEEAGDALFLFDPEQERILDVNPMAQRLTGCSRQELLKFPISYLFRAEAPQGMARLRHAFQRTGAFHSQEGYLLRQVHTGAWIPVNLTISRLHTESATLGLVTARDIREHRQVWEQLRKTEAELREVLHSVNCYLWAATVHPDGRWEQELMTPTVEKFTGYPAAYFLKRSFDGLLEILHPEDRGRMLECVRRVFAEKQTSAENEYRVVKPDGSVRWLHDSVTLAYDPDGTVHLRGVVTDVTDRKTAELASRRLAEHLRTIIETTPDCVKLVRLDGTLLDMNRAGLEMIGAESAEQVRGLCIQRFVRESQREQCSLMLQRVAKGEQVQADYEVLTLKGERRWMECRAVPLNLPGESEPLALVITTDVTQRRQAEESLRASEEKYRTLVETTDDIIWSVNARGEFTFGNAQGLRRVLGYEPEELIGKHFSVLFDVEEQQRLGRKFWVRLKKLGRYSGLECTARHKSGRPVPLRLNCVALCDAEGRYVGALGTGMDMTSLKAAEAELRREAESRRRLVDNSLAGYFRSRLDGTVLDCNEAAARILGCSSREELLATSALQFYVRPEDRQHLLATLQQQGHIRNLEAPRRRRDGSVVWLLNNVVLVHDEQGTPFIEGTIIDITERKLAEAALREQALLDSVQAKVSVALGLEASRSAGLRRCAEALAQELDLDGVWIWLVNEREQILQLAASFGPSAAGSEARTYRRGEGLPGQIWQSGLPMTIPDCSARDDAREFASGSSGGPVAWSGYPLLVEDRLYGVLAIRSSHPLSPATLGVMDRIGDVLAQWLRRKEAEEALRASEERYRTLVENLEQCIFLKDRQFRFVAVNRQFCQELGLAEEQILGKDDFDLYPSDLAEKYRRDDQLVLMEGKRLELEEENEVQGVRRTVRVIKTPLRGPGGEIEGVLGIFWDVSAQRRLERELRHAQKMEAVGQLAGGIAHDFNNLLQGIMGNIALVLETLPQTDPNRALLLAADKAATRASELVRNLLSFSRRVELKLSVVSLNQVVEETLELIQTKMPANIRIKRELDPGLGPIQADPGQLGRVVMNLCLNARDAMPHGGTLTLRTANVEITPEEAASYVGARAGPAVCLQVIDTGQGMSADVRSRIFEPFFTTKGLGKGTGLGLSMVLGIVQQHRGWLDCWSEPGKGTVFTIWLPRDPRLTAIAPTPARTAPEPLPGGQETILVVDDESLVRSLARTILQRLGYKVLEAGDGQQAIELFRRYRQQIALVILDWTMPGLSGADTLRELLRLEPQVRVLVSSGHGAVAVGERAPGQVVGFLGKPYRPEELARTVRAALETGPVSAQTERTPTRPGKPVRQ
jgi:PAS domain S-box-containing protein